LSAHDRGEGVELKQDRRVTLQDIAQKAGVSVATVSMVLRGKGNVSLRTRSAIKGIAIEMGYAPQQSRERRYVAILEYECFSYQWNFIKPFIVSLSQALLEASCYPLIFHLEKGEPTESLCARIVESGCSALCSIHYGDGELFSRVSAAGIPIILLNNGLFQEDYSTVCVDDFQGCYAGANHLIERGHRDILYLDYTRTDLEGCVVDRYLGFRKGIDEHGISFPEGRRVTLNLENKEDLRNRFRVAMSKNADVSALFIHDDYLAVWIIDELQKMGIAYPEDISLISPGDTLDFSQPFTPQFTTIQIDTYAMGSLAARLIQEKIICFDSPATTLRVTPRIVDRGSCQASVRAAI
jgi:LacI family transcriptional regulator